MYIFDSRFEDFAKSTKLLASTTLRTVLGTKTMAEILTDREHIADEIMDPLDKATDPWGIKVHQYILLMSVCFPKLFNLFRLREWK